MGTIYINPRTNKVQAPKQIYVENETESLVIYENFGSDFLVNKITGLHQVVNSKRFDVVYDRILLNK